MTEPLIYDTGDDINLFQELLSMPQDAPLHLTTALCPLPEELRELPNITYLRLQSGKEWRNCSERNLFDLLSQLPNLETLILERSVEGALFLSDSFYKLTNLKHLTILGNWFSRNPLCLL